MDLHARLPANYLSNLESAKQYKELGNERYKNGEYGAALGQYHRGIIYLKAIEASQKTSLLEHLGGPPASGPLPADKKQEVDQLYADCQSNLAACLLQSQKPSYTRVVDCCNEAISRVPNNVKAHYRLGVALYHLKRYTDAIDALQKASKLQSKPDGNVTKYLTLCRKEISDEKQRERDRCKAMFLPSDSNVASCKVNGV